MNKSLTFIVAIGSFALFSNFTVSACTPTLPSAVLKEFKLQMNSTNSPHPFTISANTYKPVNIEQFKPFERFNGTLELVEQKGNNLCTYALSEKDKRANPDAAFVEHKVDVYMVPTKLMHK